MNTGLVKVLKSASAQQTYTCKFFYSEFSKLILHKSTLFFFFPFKNELTENSLRIAYSQEWLFVTGGLYFEAGLSGWGMGMGWVCQFLMILNQAHQMAIFLQLCSPPWLNLPALCAPSTHFTVQEMCKLKTVCVWKKPFWLVTAAFLILCLISLSLDRERKWLLERVSDFFIYSYGSWCVYDHGT